MWIRLPNRISLVNTSLITRLYVQSYMIQRPVKSSNGHDRLTLPTTIIGGEGERDDMGAIINEQHWGVFAETLTGASGLLVEVASEAEGQVLLDSLEREILDSGGDVVALGRSGSGSESGKKK